MSARFSRRRTTKLRTMTHPDVESLERAVLAAVAPPQVEELPGWLLAFDNGTVGRAKSAVPIVHDNPRREAIAEIEARYAAHGLPPVFRIPATQSFDGLRDELAARGLRESKPTQMQVAATSDVGRISKAPAADVSAQADDEWASVFLGEGFDPVDGASRVQTLRRAKDSLYACVRDEGRVVAGGVLSLAHGWASIHGMRTARSHRGKGLASRIIATFANIAQERGYERMMLQVERNNEAAQRLYARCGFHTAWDYSYWETPAS